jgi:hypothetical protein
LDGAVECENVSVVQGESGCVEVRGVGGIDSGVEVRIG